MNQLESLYQEIILDHSRRRVGAVPAADLESPAAEQQAQSHQHNPLCGDDITLRATVGADGIISALQWSGDGCSISMASASVLAEDLTGRTVAEFDAALADFRELMHSRGKVEPDEEKLGDAAAFAGVSKFPARVKCALLGWAAAEDAVHRAGA